MLPEGKYQSISTHGLDKLEDEDYISQQSELFAEVADKVFETVKLDTLSMKERFLLLGVLRDNVFMAYAATRWNMTIEQAIDLINKRLDVV